MKKEKCPKGWQFVTVEEEPGCGMVGLGISFADWLYREKARLERSGIESQIIKCGRNKIALVRKP